MAALLDSRRASYFRSPALWITVRWPRCCCAKHLGHSLFAAAGFLAGGAGYAAVPVLLVLAFSRPSRAAFADMLLPGTPEQRFPATAFWTTLLLPALVAILFGFEINSLWTISAFVLLPIVLLSWPLIEMSRRAMAPILLAAAALPLVSCWRQHRPSPSACASPTCTRRRPTPSCSPSVSSRNGGVPPTAAAHRRR